jgi:hypothetical protein
MNPLTGNELLNIQRDDLQKVLDEYHAELKRLDSRLQSDKITKSEHGQLGQEHQLACAKKIRTVLLPDQLESIAKNSRRTAEKT